MFPPDMQAALMGGAAPQPAAGGLPPDMMAALGGAGPEGMAPPEEAAPDMDPEEAYRIAFDSTDDPMTLINWSVEMARKAAQMEEDPEDTLKIEKATTALAQYLADLQKEGDGLLQGKATPKALRRAAGSLSEAGGGY